MSDAELTNDAIATELERYAGLLEIAGESPFRIRAYQRAAEAIRFHPQPISEMTERDQLQQIPGIGAGIAALLIDMFQTGTLQPSIELQQSYPLTLLDLRDLSGVGPKTVAKLHSDLGIATLADLQAALDAGRLSKMAGMGGKAQARIQEALQARLQLTGRFRLGTALPVARRFLRLASEALPSGSQISLAGSVRRWEETVADIDIVIGTDQPDRDVALLTRLPDVHAVSQIAAGRYRFQLQSGIPLDLTLTTPADFGTILVRATGNAAHVSALGELPSATSEEELYRQLGLDWIPPELRQGRDEVDLARSHRLPKLVTVADIRGEFHCHTTWSDGSGTLEEMTASAIAHGYQFLGISDHSGGLGVAGGLNRDRLREQRAAIEAIRPLRPELRIYASSEVEVARNGNLDFDDETLAALDVVIASLHVGLRQPRQELTDRLVGILENPNVDIIAHPSGRLIEQRPGGDFDWDCIFTMAAKTGTVLEINADPARLDLSGDNARRALAAGCRLTINCDAHHPDGFDSLEYGVATARRAGATALDIINCWPIEQIDAWRTARS